jgi:cell surface protein SprA
MNVVGSIGDKLKLGTNFNTLANFDFQNQLKLGHTGSEDDILQKIEAGNVSLPLRSTLIQGSQSLFGLKTELRFGRLNVTALASQQKSRRQNLQIQGGTQLQTFDVTVDNYDENRHFFLSHYNRGQYETALRNLPAINSLMQITRMEVWVTNTRNATTDTRDVVAFSDLGESSRIANGNFSVMGDAPRDIAGQVILPSNKTNDLYSRLLANPDTRSLDRTVATLQGASFNMSQVRDFEKVRGRLLQSSEFSYEPQLGYISVNVTLQPDDVLALRINIPTMVRRIRWVSLRKMFRLMRIH